MFPPLITSKWGKIYIYFFTASTNEGVKFCATSERLLVSTSLVPLHFVPMCRSQQATFIFIAYVACVNSHLLIVRCHFGKISGSMCTFSITPELYAVVQSDR